MITTTAARTQAIANGSTVTFAYTFPILDESQINVVVTTAGVDSVKVLNTDFTVTGAGNASGGTITLNVAPANLAVVTIYRTVPYTQLVDYVPNSNFPAETHEAALDKLTMEVQQIADSVSRSLQFPVTEPLSTSVTLSSKASRLNTLLGFDAAGDPYLYTIDPNLLTISAGSVGTAQIQDGAVTAAKLATTLNLSTKTLTLPANSVKDNNVQYIDMGLDSAYDVRLRYIRLAKAELDRMELSQQVWFSSAGGGKLLQSKAVSVNLPNPAPIIVSGTGATDGTYTYAGIDSSGFPYWTFGSYKIYKDPTTLEWILWNGTSIVYQEFRDDDGFSAVTNHSIAPSDHPIDACWGGDKTMAGRDAHFSIGGPAVDVSGDVRATRFLGDGSQLTGLPNQAVSFAAFPNRGDKTGFYSDRNCYCTIFLNADGTVSFVGSFGTGVLSSAGGSAPSKSIVRPPFKVGALAGQVLPGTTTPVAANLNDWTDPVVKVVNGKDIALALTKSGLVYAIGNNAAGECGQGNTTVTAYWRGIKFGTTNVKIVDIACNGYPAGSNTGATCAAIDVNGKLWTWGSNYNGQVGNGASGPGAIQNTPYNNAAWAFNSETVVQVVCNALCVWVLTNTGKVYGAGFNGAGELGISGDTSQKVTFTLMTGTGTTYIGSRIFAVGGYFSTTDTTTFLVQTTDGKLWGCGAGQYGTICNAGGTGTSNTALLSCASGTVFSKVFPMGIYAGWVLAVKASDGSAVTWGYNQGGCLGNGNTTNQSTAQTPTALNAALTNGVTVVECIGRAGAITSNTDPGQTIILLSDGRVWTAGDGSIGTAGDGTGTGVAGSNYITAFQRIPLQPLVSSINAVHDGTYNGAVLLADTSNRVWGCGSQGSYQLGLGNTDTYTTPTQLRL